MTNLPAACRAGIEIPNAVRIGRPASAATVRMVVAATAARTAARHAVARLSRPGVRRRVSYYRYYLSGVTRLRRTCVG